MNKKAKHPETRTIESYLKGTTWRLKENSNKVYCFGGLRSFVSERALANYALREIYPPEISKLHKEGFIHIHDLGSALVCYCCGWDVSDILYQGLQGVSGVIESLPPQHLSSVIMQLENFLGSVQNENAGAQALNSFDTYLAPFVRKDKLTKKQVEQIFQGFIFNINRPYRFGNETPFINLSMDLIPPADLKEQHIVLNGKLQNETYADFQPEMDILNEAFLKVLLQGDARGRPFTFPIPTFSVTSEFDFSSRVGDLIAQVTSKFGLPYFDNYWGSGNEPASCRSMCCHLRLNLDELQKKGGGGLFGSGVKTGSIGVVSIDMARLGFLHKNDEDALLGHLEEIMGEASKSLEIKRKLLKKNLDRGLMPWTQKYLGSFDHHFSTVGPIGMHECCLNMFGEGIQSDNGLKFALKVLKFMRQKLLDFQESTGHLYNLEEIPAEGASHRLAVIDRNSCRGIKLSGERQSPYLTNSTHLPVDLYDDPWKAIKHQEQLQQLYSGGSAFHLLLGQSVSSKAVKSLVSKICQNSKIPYLSITPTFSVCPQCGYIAGTHEICPTCGREADIYSRVVGYLRPVKSWNEGKKQEFAERKTFIINADLEEKNEELNELQGDW